MAVVRRTNTTEFNEIFTNPESQSELDAETESESEISEYRDSDVKSPMEVSDNEDVSSSGSSTFTSKLWSRSNFKPKLFQFQNDRCGIACDLNGESPLDFSKLFFDQKLIEIIVDETNAFQVHSSHKYSSLSRQAKWIPTDFQKFIFFSRPLC